MPEKYEIKLASTSLVYHLRNENRSLICKLSIHDGEIVGVFIDGNLWEELEQAIRRWAKKAAIKCPEKICTLGGTTTRGEWTPSRR